MRQPIVEPLFSGARLQPYIHDIYITLNMGGQNYGFRAFFKRHKYLSHNRSILPFSESLFYGDLLIMRTDERGWVIPMMAGDPQRADIVVNK
jgi:hypothetical protein